MMIVLLDGIKPQLINRKNAPFISKVGEHCFLRVKSLLGYSEGIHPSIWTGTYQQTHGLFLIYYYDPLNSNLRWTKSLRILPNFLRKYVIAGAKYPFLKNPALERHAPIFIKEKLLSLPPTLPIRLAHYFSNRKIKPKVKDFFEILRENGIDFSWQTDRDIGLKNLKVTGKDIEIFYFYKLDPLGHWYGSESFQVKLYLKQVDKKIQQLYFRRKKTDEIFIFSDHGMVDVKFFVDIQSYLQKSQFVPEKDYIPFFDSTLARFWIKNKQIKRKFIIFLKKLNGLTYINKTLLEKYKIDFGDKKWGEIMFLANPQTRIFPDFFAPVKGKIRALHGYDPEFPDSYGFFCSNCIQSKKKEMNIVDILPTMLKILKIKAPKSVEGSVI